jgi:hypothetical protein
MRKCRYYGGAEHLTEKTYWINGKIRSIRVYHWSTIRLEIEYNNKGEVIYYMGYNWCGKKHGFYFDGVTRCKVLKFGKFVREATDEECLSLGIRLSIP